MRDLSKQTIGQIVATDYRTAEIFEKRGIDFCCKGDKVLKEACQKHNINEDELIDELLEKMNEEVNRIEDYQSWPPDVLADHIEKKHHRYVDKQIPVLKEYLDRICMVHGDKHPELFEIKKKFEESAGDLTVHMKKEEFILFPFIRKMVKADETGKDIASPQFGTIRNPIEMMMQEHDTEGGRFEEISSLSKGYQAPHDACNTYRLTYSMLEEFEKDLHLHIHLENNILFPKAIKMEQEFN